MMVMVGHLQNKMVSVSEFPRICAITCCYKFDTALDYIKLDLSTCDVLQDYIKTGEFVCPTKLTKKKSQVHVPMPFKLHNTTVFYRCRYTSYSRKNGETRSNFLNQICFYFVTLQNKKRCFKVFRNSLIHVTGFNNENDMDATTKEFYTLLSRFVGGDILPTVISSRKINMFNMVFKFSHKLRLEVINSYFNTIKDFKVIFEPELYVGLMLTGPLFKLILFRSGSVLITGTKSQETAMSAFSTLSDIVMTAPSTANLYYM